MAKLLSLVVAVVGCGSVGGRIAEALLRLGIPSLLLIDPKSYKAESHLTHASLPRDIGRGKARHVGQCCKALNPNAQVRIFEGAVQELPLSALTGVDVLFLATDNLAAEVATGELATLLGKPLIHGSLHGASLTAQVRTLENASGESPCPACGFGATELEQLDLRTRFSCEGGARSPAVPLNASAPTSSVSSLCSLSADLVVHQLLRRILNLGEPVTDTLLTYNGYTHECTTSPLHRNPDCRCAHEHAKRVNVREPLEDLSPAVITRRAEADPAAPDTLLELDGLGWIESGACDCPQPVSVGRFLRPGATLRRRCRQCAKEIKPLEFFTHRSVPLPTLGAHADIPAKKLGARGLQAALVRSGHTTTLLTHNARSSR